MGVTSFPELFGSLVLSLIASSSPQGFSCAPCIVPGFGICWVAQCLRAGSQGAFVWVEGVGFSPQTFRKTVLTKQRSFLILGFFSLFCFILDNWDWQLVASFKWRDSNPLFSCQFATNLELLHFFSGSWSYKKLTNTTFRAHINVYTRNIDHIVSWHWILSYMEPKTRDYFFFHYFWKKEWCPLL